jgi:UDP-3-O-[3-hydroxymyristoyl] glucosamine N-acyltransferase
VAAPSDARPTTGGGGDFALTAADVAAAVGGRLSGDPEVRVMRIAPLDRAGPGDLSFYASERYAPSFAASRAAIVLVAPAFEHSESEATTRVIVDNPHDALLALIPRFYRPRPRRPGVHPTAHLGRDVRLGADVSIGPHVTLCDDAVVGDRVVIDSHCHVGERVRVGDDSHLYPGVVAYSGTEIGRRVLVQAGAILGSDGFGYVFRGGKHEKIPHVGRCVIEDDVEIGANTTIDRGSIDDTVIGAGTKIDNLVHVAHNVRIGKRCLLMAQVGIAGSTRIEDGCVIAGQVGIAGHRTIGAGARLGAQAGAFGDVPAGETWSGYPARPHAEALRAQAVLFRLPKIIRRLERLAAQNDER